MVVVFYYLAVAIAAIITTVVFIAPVGQQVKGGLIGLSLVVLVCMCFVGATIHWAHVPGMLVTYFISTRVVTIIYKAATKNKGGK